jgi:polar amino acid transport system substrate-binding protein
MENKRFPSAGRTNLQIMREGRFIRMPRLARRVRRLATWPCVALGLTMMLAVSAALAQPTAATAPAPQQLQIVGAHRPPYMIENNGFGTGPAIDLLQILARSIGVDPAVRIVPFQRALLALEQGHTLYPALLRTPQREKRFIWIGEVYADRAVFFTRRDRTPVGSLTDARDLPRVSVMRGSELQGMLESFGLENFETTNSEIDNARLLQAGRIDGWFALRAVGRATWAQLKFDPAELQASEAFATLPFWIAASSDLPPQTVTSLRATYRATRTDGRYRRIIAPLLALERPH